MIPSQREFAAKMAGKPFTYFGINSDQMSRSALKAKLAKEKITWPQLLEGNKKNNYVSRKWNVTGFPTLFVIDHEGVIRARGFLSEEKIEELVMELIQEIPEQS